MYSFHLFLISSGSVKSFPVSSFIASHVQLVVFFFVNCQTFAYTKSGRALRCNSSSISFLNNSTLVTRLSNSHFFCCLLLGIFFNLSFNRTIPYHTIPLSL